MTQGVSRSTTWEPILPRILCQSWSPRSLIMLKLRLNIERCRQSFDERAKLVVKSQTKNLSSRPRYQRIWIDSNSRVTQERNLCDELPSNCTLDTQESERWKTYRSLCNFLNHSLPFTRPLRSALFRVAPIELRSLCLSWLWLLTMCRLYLTIWRQSSWDCTVVRMESHVPPRANLCFHSFWREALCHRKRATQNIKSWCRPTNHHHHWSSCLATVLRAMPTRRWATHSPINM
mmetsp:Transcript_11151/g.41660  ORF Transcript_11151/g.41660 Transcript_11151/m.41660 type:complete len:233 (-) Transcript_11151:846-1544(-)